VDKKTAETACQDLDEMLETGLKSRIDTIELQWLSGEGLEVMFFTNENGVGGVLDKRGGLALYRLVRQLAGLDDREEGSFVRTIGGKEVTVVVQTYENFGETVLRLKLPWAPKRRGSGAGKR